MRIAIFALACLVLSACDDVRGPNQCLRRELFKECMQLLPAGPIATHYNDWDEVVQECRNRAYYESHRLESTIPVECK